MSKQAGVAQQVGTTARPTFEIMNRYLQDEGESWLREKGFDLELFRAWWHEKPEIAAGRIRQLPAHALQQLQSAGVLPQKTVEQVLKAPNELAAAEIIHQEIQTATQHGLRKHGLDAVIHNGQPDLGAASNWVIRDGVQQVREELKAKVGQSSVGELLKEVNILRDLEEGRVESAVPYVARKTQLSQKAVADLLQGKAESVMKDIRGQRLHESAVKLLPSAELPSSTPVAEDLGGLLD
jgi:hypothetical protein